MTVKRATITALGKYAPERILTNHDLEQMVDTNDEWIRTRTGIVERHIAREDEATSDLAVGAFRDLQNRFHIDPLKIDLIILATITPDMFFPSTAALFQEKIGATNAWGFDISAACSGFTYALTVGQQFINTGNCKNVLVIGADKMSSITDYTDRDTCVLFGDGAGIVLLQPAAEGADSGIVDTVLKLDGTGKDYLYMLGGGSKHPATHATVDKKMHYIYQEGRSVFKFAVSGMASISLEILKKNGLKGSDIALFVPHQANKRIIDACASRMHLREEQVLSNIDRYANTTAATIPIGLVDAIDANRIQKGDYVLLSSFGAGFTWGSVLLKWGI